MKEGRTETTARPSDTMRAPRPPLEEALLGCLLGTAVGDAVGLPAEGLGRARLERRYPDRWSHRLVFGRGMLSDDTEHTVFVAQALLRSRGDEARFRRSLARSLRWWLLALPAGTGMATARSILRLWIGISPERSGVFSAGNGPSMRSALLGVIARDDEAERTRLVAASTRITHSDPKAWTGARAVAEAAAWCARGEDDAQVLLGHIACLGDEEWRRLVGRLGAALARGSTVAELAEELDLGKEVGGYTYHSVPVSLYAALRHADDPPRALQEIWRAGGDTDTNGAIAGAILGSRGGIEEWPDEWIGGIVDWPRSTSTLRDLASALARPREQWAAVSYPAWGVLPRNLVFLFVVLAHGLRRLVPG